MGLRCPFRKSIERLPSAYQEGLISRDALRQRMPDLRMHEQRDQAELQAIADQSAERTACLRLAEIVTDFLARLHLSAGTLDVSEHQRVLRLLVKDILVGDDKIVIRHSIPLPTNPSGGHSPKADLPGPSPTQSEGYLLRSWRKHTALRVSPGSFDPCSILKLHRCCQPSFDVQQSPFALHMFADSTRQLVDKRCHRAFGATTNADNFEALDVVVFERAAHLIKKVSRRLREVMGKLGGAEAVEGFAAYRRSSTSLTRSSVCRICSNVCIKCE